MRIIYLTLKKEKMAKRTVYCRIDQWLKKTDPELFAAFDDLCALHILKPKPAGGITFLYPTDEAYRKEIIDNSIGTSEEQTQAEKMLKSLVLQLHLPDANSFQTYSDDIPNTLGIHTPISEVKGATVSFNGDLTASVAKNFAPRGDRVNMAVWELKGKDRLPIDGNKALGTHTKRGKKEGGMRKPITDRVEFAKLIEEKFRNYAITNKILECDPYLESLVSFLVWAKGSDRTDLLRSVLICCSPKWRPSFYIAFQPYSDAHLISDAEFTAWQNETMGYCFVENPAKYYLAAFKDINSDEKDCCASAESRTKLRSAIEKKRQEILKTIAKSTLSTNLQKLYTDLAASNSIGELSNVYPATLSAYLQSNPEHKAVQEEIRFLMGRAFSDLTSSGYGPEEFCTAHKQLVDILEHRYNFKSGFRSCMCFNTELQTSGTSWYSGPFALLRSNYLLYTAAPNGESSVPDDVNAVFEKDVTPSAIVMVDTVSQDWAAANAVANSMRGSDKCSVVKRMLELTQKASS